MQGFSLKVWRVWLAGVSGVWGGGGGREEGGREVWAWGRFEGSAIVGVYVDLGSYCLVRPLV